MVSSFYIDLVIKTALSEDLTPHPEDRIEITIDVKEKEFIDVTSDAIFHDEECQADILAKSEGVLSGSSVVKRVFEIVDPSLFLQFHKTDSEFFSKGEKIATLKGKIKSLLRGERIALNFLGHLSGIATEVNKLVKVLVGTEIKILDTRKTLPGLRELEKKAVVHGGGENHRMGLYDMILIKDNHIDAAGSITEAVKRVRVRYGARYKIEVETRWLTEVEEAVSCRVDRIMLDNMQKNQIKRAVRIIGGKAEIEVSGNMNRKTIRKLRNLPVDYISSGYITNAAGHSDFSMKIK